MILLLVYPVVKGLHELGHGYAVKKWGGEVHEMGVTFLVFVPLPYVDASSSAVIRSRRQRMAVGAAGMMVELDMTDRAVIKRWQKRVVDGDFAVEDCANELYDAGRGRLDELRLMERSGRLLRDFLMAPLARGARGAGRRARMATKRGAAWVVAQFIIVAIYTVILLLIMAFLYQRGTSFDGLFEKIFSRG